MRELSLGTEESIGASIYELAILGAYASQGIPDKSNNCLVLCLAMFAVTNLSQGLGMEGEAPTKPVLCCCCCCNSTFLLWLLFQDCICLAWVFPGDKEPKIKDPSILEILRRMHNCRFNKSCTISSRLMSVFACTGDHKGVHSGGCSPALSEAAHLSCLAELLCTQASIPTSNCMGIHNTINASQASGSGFVPKGSSVLLLLNPLPEESTVPQKTHPHNCSSCIQRGHNVGCRLFSEPAHCPVELLSVPVGTRGFDGSIPLQT